METVTKIERMKRLVIAARYDFDSARAVNVYTIADDMPYGALDEMVRDGWLEEPAEDDDYALRLTQVGFRHICGLLG